MVDNQHRLIRGYRELSEGEIALMNLVKLKAQEIGELLETLEHQIETKIDIRWLSIARTQLQQGFMALTRSVARPEFF